MINNVILKDLKAAIANTKFESKVYLVGGAVRDYFLNVESKDLDFVVEMESGGIELAKYLFKIWDTHYPVIFPKFGTAHIEYKGYPLDFVNTRSEIYDMKSRNPIVKFASLEEDLARRDFSCNAVAYNISNESFVDIKGGIIDIQNGVIRTTSDPNIIFAEDPLRIMRAVRFAARLRFDIESKTLTSLKNNVHKLKFISRERIRDEFLKILVIKNGAGVKLLKDTGILGFLMPEFDKMDDVNSNKNVWIHTLSVLNHSKNTTNHKMAALFHDLGKVYSANTVDGKVNFHGHQFESEKLVVKFMKTFRFTNKEIDLVSLAVRLHMDIDQVITVKTVRRLINTHGKDSMLFVLDLCIADVDRRKSNRDRVSFLRDLRSGIESDRFLKKTVEPLFAGKALMKMFNLKPSKKIGQLIEFQIDMLLGDPDITADEMILMLKTQL